jgi:hypothetical protein
MNQLKNCGRFSFVTLCAYFGPVAGPVMKMMGLVMMLVGVVTIIRGVVELLRCKTLFSESRRGVKHVCR